MAKEKIKLINKFYGGITRDDKSKIAGVAANIEELDIFSNADYIQAEQIFSSYALPATTEVYAYTSNPSDTVYAYGKETAGSKVRILSVASGGGSAPSTLSTLFTSADATNLAYVTSPIQFFRTTEAQTDYLYYITNASGTVLLRRYNITAASEATVGTLTGLTGSSDRVSMKVLFGELFVTNGKYIASVDKDGVFTNTAFTLPSEWIAVDIVAVSDVSIILARSADSSANFCKGFWWDLTSSLQVDDSFDIAVGGPQWIVNHKETIKIMCAINGVARFFQLSGAFPGAVPVELPGIVLPNMATETSSQVISSPKMVGVKDKILYFGAYKTDKTGVYAIGQLDADKPNALILSKRFATTDYSLHKPTALFIVGSDFYAAFSDNGTASSVRCATLNTPSRSATGTYESIFIDDDNPIANKSCTDIYVTTRPLPASTSVLAYVGADYGSYTQVFRADGTSLTGTNGTMGNFKAKSFVQNKVYQVKLVLVSSTSNSPKVSSVGLKLFIDSEPGAK